MKSLNDPCRGSRGDAEPEDDGWTDNVVRVRCYEEGNDRRSDTFAIRDSDPEFPKKAAELWVEENFDSPDDGDVVNVVVEPATERALALPGWMNDGDGPPFRLFKVKSRVEWKTEEVQTFNTNAPVSVMRDER